ncbi:MAG: glycosyltransferase family 2 protein, partial [Chloroflexi bacterium]|nr:glycosyltransferase family 2 protein [Chloroflexota bacterium]
MARPGSAPGPALSIVIPTWNSAGSITRAIESITADAAVDLECLVIDDGSTDGTADVVAAIATRDQRVHLTRLGANVGVSEARNRGIEDSRGAWIAFLDADDRILPGGIAALWRAKEDSSVRVVIGQRIITNGDRTWISRAYDRTDIRQPGRKSIQSHPELMYYASIHGKLFERSLVQDLRFDGRVLGDQPWTIGALLRAGPGIEVISDVVYEWFRPHPDRYVEGITAATRAFTDRAADMALRTSVAFEAVSRDVDRLIADGMTGRMIKSVYFHRLVVSDLRVPVDIALARRDPSTGRLFDAVAEFLEHVPPPILAGSELLV